MIMHIVIVGHHKRRVQAASLAEHLDGHLLIDEGDHGAQWNHRRALMWTAQQDEPVVVLEDDAVPCEGFLDHAESYADRFPGRLISLYLGTGRPPNWQRRMRREIRHADDHGHDFIELTQLCHAVGYIVWPGIASHILTTMRTGPADFMIGNAWRKLTRKPVIYTLPSLVDHADEQPVELHPDGQARNEPRKAWRLIDDSR